MFTEALNKKVKWTLITNLVHRFALITFALIKLTIDKGMSDKVNFFRPRNLWIVHERAIDW